MNELITRIEIMNPKPSETVVLYFNTKDFKVDMVNAMFEIVRERFPNNRIVALPDEMSLKDFGKETLLEHLNNIAADLMN